MKVIGLLGGMSWESSAEYYRIINTEVKRLRGGLHSARVILFSLDFAEIEKLQHAGNWEAATAILVDAARRLELAGASCLVICTNTMHLMAEAIQAAISIPLLHIADSTAERVTDSGIRKIGLLGTRFTMEKDFYKGRLESKFGLEVVVPGDADRDIIHRIIYQELCLGEIRDQSKEQYREVLSRLSASGAAGCILGCTEIELLISQRDTTLPLFCTARIHAEAAVEWALGG